MPPPTHEPEHDAQERFRALYDAHFRAVLGYALRRVGRPSDAADVVSETFLVAWRRLEELPPGDPLPWLLGVARRVLANHHRGDRRRDRLGARLRERLTAEAVPDPAAGVALADDVRRALRRLPPTDRELVTLVAWDGLAVGEAGAVLGLGPGAARMRMSRARARLRDQLGPDVLGDTDERTGHLSHDRPAPAHDKGN